MTLILASPSGPMAQLYGEVADDVALKLLDTLWDDWSLTVSGMSRRLNVGKNETPSVALKAAVRGKYASITRPLQIAAMVAFKQSHTTSLRLVGSDSPC